MIIGNQLSTTNATVPEQIVLTISRDLSIQLLLLYLVQILRSERATRENVSELMAHRIRSSLQGISSQLKVLDSERKDQLGFTSEDRKRAKLYLEDTFRQLTQLSLVPHSGIRLFDVKSAIREFVPLGDIIWDACADFQDFANYQDIKIEVSDTVSRLPLVYVNRTLMRLAIATLIDNGIKNSSPPPKGKGGSIQINTNNGLAERGASVKVVSYGIGIKGIDLERVFEWNTRLAYSPHHKNATGLGAGLWEVKYIVEGHGGHISASSVHYSGEPITNENISQCVTTFTVTLPVGKGS
jgi:signal transduction histidine kinase